MFLKVFLKVFKGIPLLSGWMVTHEHHEMEQCESKRKKKNGFIQWEERFPIDCMNDLAIFCDTIINRMDLRYDQSVTEAAHILGNCLHVPDILSCIQGETERFTVVQHAALNAYGKQISKRFYKYFCSLRHIHQLSLEEPELNLDHTFSESVHQSYKDLIFNVVWNDFSGCRLMWFPPVKGLHGSGKLKGFQISTETSEIEETYKFSYEDRVCTARLDYPSVFATLYINEEIYTLAGKELCIAIDIALAMSGSEAVVESYYSLMKAQKMAGGQSNETLFERTNVDWCFPNPLQC